MGGVVMSRVTLMAVSYNMLLVKTVELMLVVVTIVETLEDIKVELAVDPMVEILVDNIVVVILVIISFVVEDVIVELSGIVEVNPVDDVETLEDVNVEVAVDPIVETFVDVKTVGLSLVVEIVEKLFVENMGGVVISRVTLMAVS